MARKTLKLDLSSLGICDIPAYVYADPLLRFIRILWLNHNEFEALPPEIAALQELTQLRAFHNRLRWLPPELGELHKLQILWLQDNLLDTLPPEIEQLTSLTLLSLKGNPLRVLPVELSRLKRVREMELDTELLTFPPPAISRAGTRQVQEFLRRADRAWTTGTLDLSCMDLDSLPLDIVQLFPDIDRLWFSGNPVDHLPFEFAALTHITDLRFDSVAMRSPSMKIWGLGLPRAFEFMREFLGFRREGAVSLAGWGLDEVPGEVLDTDLGPRLTSLDMSRNTLTGVPPEIARMQALTSLKLDFNAIQELPASLCQLTSLIRLSVSNNQLSSFPDGMKALENLVELTLDCNSLLSLPPSILFATSLRLLSLSSNCIVQLPTKLPQLSNLRLLLVQDNAMQRLPLEFGNFRSLTRLSISGNPLWSPPKDILDQALPVWFTYLDRLSIPIKARAAPGRSVVNDAFLELSRFKLTQFPPEISRFPLQYMSLTQITMDNNRMSTLPKELGKLTNLTSLSFARNLFRVCPPVLGKLFNLAELNLEKNLLTFIPMEIGHLTALKILRVEGNQISHPPMEVVKLGVQHVLRFLKVFAQGSVSGEVIMAGNNLKAVPVAISDLDNLTRLDLSHNCIGRIPMELLRSTTVTHLDLSYNALSELEPNFSGLVNLRILMLTANQIEVIGRELLALTKLEVLVMNRNLLDDIPAEVSVLKCLRELKVSSNRLEDLPMEIGRLPSLIMLNVANNVIAAIPATVGNLTALRSLSLACNDLSGLPPILGVMTGLQHVHLLDNDLDRHPSEVVEAARVLNAKNPAWHDGRTPVSPLCLWLARMRAARITRALDASCFGLEKVPAEVLGLTALQILQLGLAHNKIRALHHGISLLTALTHLDLAYNKLEILPTLIGGMTNLTILYLNDNRLVRLPIELGYLPPANLKRLTINNNKLETPPRELLSLPTPQILRYFSSSKIAILTGVLDWSWCKSLLSMRSICLEMNNWTALVAVDLDDNEIASIDAEMCLAMERLESLSLRRNRLTKVPERLCLHSRLRALALSSNRLVRLPIALCSMRSMAALEVTGMQMEVPCSEIVRYGSENILAYLHALHQAHADHVCIISQFDLSQVPHEVADIFQE